MAAAGSVTMLDSCGETPMLGQPYCAGPAILIPVITTTTSSLGVVLKIVDGFDATNWLEVSIPRKTLMKLWQESLECVQSEEDRGTAAARDVNIIE
jgi:hypothetical protein